MNEPFVSGRDLGDEDDRVATQYLADLYYRYVLAALKKISPLKLTEIRIRDHGKAER